MRPRISIFFSLSLYLYIFISLYLNSFILLYLDNLYHNILHLKRTHLLDISCPCFHETRLTSEEGHWQTGEKRMWQYWKRNLSWSLLHSYSKTFTTKFVRFSRDFLISDYFGSDHISFVFEEKPVFIATYVTTRFTTLLNQLPIDTHLQKEVNEHGHSCIQREDFDGRHVDDGTQEKRHALGNAS